MIIKKITVKNFFRYADEQTLDLTGTGITAITGSNGVGKSSLIIDSILFAFYGKYRTKTVDEIINKWVGNNCKVGVEFEIDGKEYKVLRYRKHTTHNNNVYIFEGDKDISGHTASETNAKIIDIIKMPYIAFTNSCVFSSELYSAFLSNKTSERLNVFENILSLKEVNAFYVATKEIIKDFNDKKEEVVLKNTSIENERKALQYSLDQYTSNARSKLLSMKAEKDEANKNIADIQSKIKELSIIDIDEEKKKLSNVSLKKEYISSIERIRQQKELLFVKEDPKELALVEKYDGFDFEGNRLKELKYKEDMETIKARESGYKLSFEKLNSLKNEIAAINAKSNNLKEKKEELTNRIVKLNSSVCPFCGQHLSDEKNKEELEKANRELGYVEDEITENEEKLKELQLQSKEEGETYSWLLGDYNRLKEKLDKNFIPNTELIYSQYQAALKNVREVEKQRNKNAKQLEELSLQENEIAIKIENLQTTHYTEEELNSISSKIESLKEQKTEEEKKIAAIDSQVSTVYDKNYAEDLKLKIEEKGKELTVVEEDLKEVNNEIAHYTFLADCFSNKAGGFKKYFIGEMIDMFNTKVNQFLPFFFEEKVEINFDRDLNETITMDDLPMDFTGFSQGQRQRAELAVNFALFEIARVFFSNDNNLLILDEVVDKGMDKVGIKSVINLLNGFDKQLRILVVSHNPLLDEEIESKIYITKDSNGFSKIKQ